MNAHPDDGTAWDWLFLAMAHHHQGHTEPARKWLARAVTWLDETTAKKSDDAADSAPLPWDQRLSYQLLRREAESLIEPVRR